MDKKVSFVIVVAVVVLVIAVFFCFVRGGGEDIECVAASCCHATECVLASEAPDCSGRICTMSCEPGTLDCGQARCEYVKDKCEVVLNE